MKEHTEETRSDYETQEMSLEMSTRRDKTKRNIKTGRHSESRGVKKRRHRSEERQRDRQRGSGMRRAAERAHSTAAGARAGRRIGPQRPVNHSPGAQERAGGGGTAGGNGVPVSRVRAAQRYFIQKAS